MSPSADADRAVLMLPSFPASASVLGDAGEWHDVLDRWGVTENPDGELLVVTVAPPAVVAGAETLLLTISPRQRWLRRNGLVGVRYRRHAGGLQPRRVPITALGSAVARRRHDVVVAGRTSVLPAAIAAAVPDGWLDRVIVGTDPRRRTVFLVERPDADPKRVAIKVERCSSVECDRGRVEQAQLGELIGFGFAGTVPEPLGHGVVNGRITWSMESFAGGKPLATMSATDARRALDALGTWLDDLAVATRHPGSSPTGSIPLAGDHQEWATLIPTMAGVPRVRVHGDLASGANILVGDAVTVIDWETAFDGFPLLDVVPTLALGMARIAVGPGADAQASYVAALARGEAPPSSWFFASVRRHLARVGVPVEFAGRLATLAWAYQASMRARHDDLVRATGIEPPPWTSAAERVIERWASDPELGPKWRALGEAPTTGP